MRALDGKMAGVGELAPHRQADDGDERRFALRSREAAIFSNVNYQKSLAGKLLKQPGMTTTTTTTTTMKPAAPHLVEAAAEKHVEFDDLLGVAPANDVYRCSPDDPVSGMTLVRQIAASVARRLPSHVDRDELVSLGALGWAEARVRFDAGRGVPFAGFAAMRIRGAILDGLRAADTLSRGDRKRAKADSEPTAPRIVSSDEEVDAAVAEQDDASDILQREEMMEELREALDKLPQRDRYILSRHFFDDVPMRAIGLELGVTESRISQIVSAAMGRLRHHFGIALLPRKKSAARSTPSRPAPSRSSSARARVQHVAAAVEAVA
jgi:RNA polymerase sigma factor for flagellar operon FliA